MLYLKEGHKPLTAVVFDLGNVILDYDPRRFMFEMGIAPELHDRVYAATVGTPDWHELDAGNLSQADFLENSIRRDPLLKKEITLFVKTWKEYFHAVPENVACMYQVKEAGAKAYVLSNFMEATYEYEIRHNSFFRDFDGMILSFEQHLTKPEAAIYRKLIETYQLDPATTVFFDDIEENIEAARKEGLIGVILPPCAPVADWLEFEE